MYVLEIIPFSRTAPPEPLSYRSTTKLAPGTIVLVPLRKKIVPGLVIGSVPVREAKTSLKTASFSLSKSGAEKIGAISPDIIHAAANVATYHATTIGAVLSSILVPVLSEDVSVKLAKGDGFKIERAEEELLNRRAKYLSLVTKKKGSTLLVVPTQAEIDEWTEFFKAQKPVVISGKLSPKKREATIATVTRRMSATGTAQIVITTPAFSWIPLPRLNRIIIERMSAGGYTSPKRPYLDVRVALTELARARECTLIYGDYPLPLEYRASPDKSLARAPDAKVKIVDTRSDKEADIQKKDGPWRAVPELLLQQIKKTLDSKGRVAVLAVRKGYAPTVVCRDCGTAVVDDYGRPLTFSTASGKRLFRSVDGETVEAAHRKCKVCDSWNLLPLGIGVERVEEELSKAFPDTPFVRIDQESISGASLKKAKFALAEPGTIVIGTEVMLSWLSPVTPFDLGVIVSADSLLALPFWRSRERFVRVGLMLAERSKKMLVATRHPEDAALSAVASPTTSDFWKEEYGLRKILHYPPFGTLIVFQVEATAERLALARAAIKAECLPYVIVELPTRAISNSIFRGISVLHLPVNEWPNKELSERLSRLSPVIRIHIDSESLW